MECASGGEAVEPEGEDCEEEPVDPEPEASEEDEVKYCSVPVDEEPAEPAKRTQTMVNQATESQVMVNQVMVNQARKTGDGEPGDEPGDGEPGTVNQTVNLAKRTQMR